MPSFRPPPRPSPRPPRRTQDGPPLRPSDLQAPPQSHIPTRFTPTERLLAWCHVFLFPLTSFFLYLFFEERLRRPPKSLGESFAVSLLEFLSLGMIGLIAGIGFVFATLLFKRSIGKILVTFYVLSFGSASFFFLYIHRKIFPFFW